MVDRKKKGPTREFTHAPDCKILRADPGVKIAWQEVETGLWVAECVCGKEYEREAPVDRRVRLDPLDPATSRHGGGCEHRDTRDPALLQAILKVRDGAGGDYSVVECGVCAFFWQVQHFGPAAD